MHKHPNTHTNLPQLHELSSKLEDLQEDHKDSQGYGLRLKKENAELRAR